MTGIYQDPAEDIRQLLDSCTAQTGVPNLPAARDAIIAKWKPVIDRKRRANLLAAYRSAFTQQDVDGALAYFHSAAGTSYLQKLELVAKCRLSQEKAASDFDFQALWSEYQQQVRVLRDDAQKSGKASSASPAKSNF